MPGMNGASAWVIVNFGGLANTNQIEGVNVFQYLHRVGVLPSSNDQLCLVCKQLLEAATYSSREWLQTIRKSLSN